MECCEQRGLGHRHVWLERNRKWLGWIHCRCEYRGVTGGNAHDRRSCVHSDAGSGRNSTPNTRTSYARASDTRTSAIFLQVLDFASRPECGGERGNAYRQSVDHRRMLVDSGQQCVVDHRDVWRNRNRRRIPVIQLCREHGYVADGNTHDCWSDIHPDAGAVRVFDFA